MSFSPLPRCIVAPDPVDWNKVEKKEKDDVMMKKKNIRQTDNVVKIELLKQRLKSIYLGTR